MLVLKRSKPFLQSLFHPYTSSRKCHFYRTRQAWICSCDHFSATMPRVVKPVCLQCTTGGTPVTASHARMTMTVTGLPHGGRKANFPFICSTALNPSTWRCTPIPLFPFPFRLSIRMPLFPCRHPGRHQVSFSLLGAKVKTGLGTQIFCRKISTPFQG